MKRASRIYYLMSGGAALADAIAVTMYLVYLVESVQLNPLQLVLLGTVFEIAIILTEVPTGMVADSYGRRLSVIIGYVVSGVGFALTGLFQDFTIILAAQAVIGVGFTFISGAREAWLTDEVGELTASRAFHRATQVEQLMGMVGIIISVILATMRLDLPLIVGGVVYALIGFGLVFLMTEAGFKPLPATEKTSWGKMRQTFVHGMTIVRLSSALIVIVILNLIDGLYSEGYDRLWTPYMLEAFSLPRIGTLEPLAWFGVIQFVGAILTIVASEGVQRFIKARPDFSPTRLALIIYGLVFVGLIGLVLAPIFALAIASIWLVTMARAVAHPVLLTWTNRYTQPESRATVFSMISQIQSFGEAAGGPVVGYVGNRFSIRSALVTSTAILSVGLALLIRYLIGRPEAKPMSEPIEMTVEGSI